MFVFFTLHYVTFDQNKTQGITHNTRVHDKDEFSNASSSCVRHFKGAIEIMTAIIQRTGKSLFNIVTSWSAVPLFT